MNILDPLSAGFVRASNTTNSTNSSTTPLTIRDITNSTAAALLNATTNSTAPSDAPNPRTHNWTFYQYWSVSVPVTIATILIPLVAYPAYRSLVHVFYWRAAEALASADRRVADRTRRSIVFGTFFALMFAMYAAMIVLLQTLHVSTRIVLYFLWLVIPAMLYTFEFRGGRLFTLAFAVIGFALSAVLPLTKTWGWVLMLAPFAMWFAAVVHLRFDVFMVIWKDILSPYTTWRRRKKRPD